MRKPAVMLTPLLIVAAVLGLYLYLRPVPVTLQFSRAPGIEVDMPVRVGGVRVGTIEAVRLGDGGTVLARASIGREASTHIPADSVAILSADGVDLFLGESARTLHSGATLEAHPSLTEKRLGETLDSLGELLEEVRDDAEAMGRIIREKGKAAGEKLQRELDDLKEKLEEALPGRRQETPPPRSI